jgi:dermatan 4-sulfotransferase 1
MLKKTFIQIPNLKTVYAPIPKAANSSIKLALAKALPSMPVNGIVLTKQEFWTNKNNNHSTTISARTASRLSKQEWFIFSLVRHPLDRLVSCYNNKIVENTEISGSMKKCGIEKGMTFKEFLNVVINTPDRRADVHFASQWYLLSHRGKLATQFIGRFENLEQDYQHINEQITERSGSSLIKLPRKNIRRENTSDHLQHYDTSSLKAAVNRYPKDIELFYPEEKLLKLIDNTTLLDKLKKIIK